MRLCSSSSSTGITSGISFSLGQVAASKTLTLKRHVLAVHKNALEIQISTKVTPLGHNVFELEIGIFSSPYFPLVKVSKHFSRLTVHLYLGIKKWRSRLVDLPVCFCQGQHPKLWRCASSKSYLSKRSLFSKQNFLAWASNVLHNSKNSLSFSVMVKLPAWSLEIMQTGNL